MSAPPTHFYVHFRPSIGHDVPASVLLLGTTPCPTLYVSSREGWVPKAGTFVLPLSLPRGKETGGVPPPSWIHRTDAGEWAISIPIAVDEAAMARAQREVEADMEATAAIWRSIEQLEEESMGSVALLGDFDEEAAVRGTRLGRRAREKSDDGIIRLLRAADDLEVSEKRKRHEGARLLLSFADDARYTAESAIETKIWTLRQKARELVGEDSIDGRDYTTLNCQHAVTSPQGIPTPPTSVAPPETGPMGPWMLFGNLPRTTAGNSLGDWAKRFFGKEVDKRGDCMQSHITGYNYLERELGRHTRLQAAPTPVCADEGGFHEQTDTSEVYPPYLIVPRARTPLKRGDAAWYPGVDLYPHASGYFGQFDLVARMTHKPSTRHEWNRHNWDILFRHSGEDGPTKGELEGVLAWVAGHAWSRHPFYEGVVAHIHANCLPDEGRADAFVMGIVYRMRALQCKAAWERKERVRRQRLEAEEWARKADLAAKKRLRDAQEANVAENKRRRLVDRGLLEEASEESDLEDGPPE